VTYKQKIIKKKVFTIVGDVIIRHFNSLQSADHKDMDKLGEQLNRKIFKVQLNNKFYTLPNYSRYS